MKTFSILLALLSLFVYPYSAHASDPAPLAQAKEVLHFGAWACALTTQGGVKCWGTNEDGRLGVDGISQSSIPVDVTYMESHVVDIDGPCGLRDDHTLWCWGWLPDGAKGNGEIDNWTYLLATKVINIDEGVKSFAHDFYNGCAITMLDQLKCWGGLGQHVSVTPTPTLMLDGAAVSSVSLGGISICAILRDTGGIMCWGANYAGQLGNGEMTGWFDRSGPFGVVGFSNWRVYAPVIVR